MSAVMVRYCMQVCFQSGIKEAVFYIAASFAIQLTTGIKACKLGT